MLGPPGGPGGGGGGASLAVLWTATNLVTDVSIWWRSPPSIRVDIFRLVRQRICDLPPIGPGGIGHLEWAVRSLWQCPLSLDTHGLELRGLIGSLVDTSPLKASSEEPQGGQEGHGQGWHAHGGQRGWDFGEDAKGGTHGESKGEIFRGGGGEREGEEEGEGEGEGAMMSDEMKLASAEREARAEIVAVVEWVLARDGRDHTDHTSLSSSSSSSSSSSPSSSSSSLSERPTALLQAMYVDKMWTKCEEKSGGKCGENSERALERQIVPW